MPKTTDELTILPTAVLTYEAAIAAAEAAAGCLDCAARACTKGHGMSALAWNGLGDILVKAADRVTGDHQLKLLDRVADCRSRAVSAHINAVLGIPHPTATVKLAPMTLAETYSVVGPNATSLHAGFVRKCDAEDCARKLAKRFARAHYVKPVSTSQPAQGVDTIVQRRSRASV